jgi:hypothetical protein
LVVPTITFGLGATLEDDVFVDAHPAAVIAANAIERGERCLTREPGIGNRESKTEGW